MTFWTTVFPFLYSKNHCTSEISPENICWIFGKNLDFPSKFTFLQDDVFATKSRVWNRSKSQFLVILLNISFLRLVQWLMEKLKTISLRIFFQVSSLYMHNVTNIILHVYFNSSISRNTNEMLMFTYRFWLLIVILIYTQCCTLLQFLGTRWVQHTALQGSLMH